MEILLRVSNVSSLYEVSSNFYRQICRMESLRVHAMVPVLRRDSASSSLARLDHTRY